MPTRNVSAPSPVIVSIGLFTLAVGPPIIAIWLTGFDGLYGQDSISYYRYAVGPLRDSLARGGLPPPFFWPLGYPTLILIAAAIVGATPLAGQLVSLVAAGTVAVATFHLARQLARSLGVDAGLRFAIAAGALVALSGQLWQSGMVVMADTPALAMACLSAYALARYADEQRLAWCLACAGTLAGAILIRWGFALLVIPWTIAWIVLARRAPRPTITAAHAAAGVLFAMLILAPQTALSAAASSRSGVRWLAFAGDLHVYRWSPLNAFRRQFVTVDGTLQYPVPNGLYYLMVPGHWFYLTPFLAPLVVVGFLQLVRRRLGLALSLLAVWPLTMYAFHAGTAWQNYRFPLAFLPPLAILASLGFELMLDVASRERKKLVAAAFIGVFAVKTGAAIFLCSWFIGRKDADVATVRWVERQIPSDSRLLTFNLTLMFQYYGHVETLELFDQTPGSVAGLLASERSAFLFVDVRSLDAQWKERSPGRVYEALRLNPGLVPVGTHRDFTLFRIASRHQDTVRP